MLKKYLVLLVFLCYALCSCSPEDNPATKLGSIFGTVTDFATGDPIANANVRLIPRGETALTGSDGSFQFNDVTDGKYSLSLSKNGYVDLDDDYVIEIENGNNVRRDVQLSPQFQSFKITVDGVETDTLDFGVDPFVTLINYTVENNGTMEVDLVFRTSSNWITLGDYSQYGVDPNTGVTTYAEINREALNIGNNIGYIYVGSGALTKTLVVKAKGLGMPVVTDPLLSNTQAYSTNVQASVTSDGGWQIIDKGFQYYNGDYYSHGSRVISCGPGTSNFQTQIPVGVNDHSSTYGYSRVRSYASNGVYTSYSGWVDIK